MRRLDLLQTALFANQFLAGGGFCLETLLVMDLVKLTLPSVVRLLSSVFCLLPAAYLTAGALTFLRRRILPLASRRLTLAKRLALSLDLRFTSPYLPKRPLRLKRVSYSFTTNDA